MEDAGAAHSPPHTPRQALWLAKEQEDWRELGVAKVPMLVSITVLLFEWFAYNLVFLGRVLPAVGKDTFVLPFLLIFNLLWGLAIWSYVQAHKMDPGSVPKRWQEFVLSVGDSLPIAPARGEWQPGKATYCQKCRVPRPERAHHCSVCGMCVLRMDHHCPWINNCVGFNNHKFFLLVGVYCCLASLVAVVTSLPELFLCVAALLRVESGPAWQARQIALLDGIVLLVFGMLALLFFSLLTPMIASHFPLAQRNQTTIENHYDNMPNPFDQGSPLANLAQVFGIFGPDWFLPVRPLRPLSDGVSFARTDERLGADGLPEIPESMLGDEEDESEMEKIWRFRYNVQASPGSSVEKSEESRSSFLNWWWNGATTVENGRRIISL